MGFEYVAICDHSRSLGIARGLDENRLRKQILEINKLNKSLDGVTLLKGIEANIMADGSLDLSDNILKDLDFVVASVHSGFKGGIDKLTDRMITAIHNDYVSTIGHPTGRLVQKRKSYPLDLKKVFYVAAEQQVMMEINAFPNRLDLNDVNCRAANMQGVSMSIGTDAHSVDQLKYLPLGVSVARRGWLQAEDVVNTFYLKDLLKRVES